MATPRPGRKPRASGERELDNSNSVFSGLSSDIRSGIEERFVGFFDVTLERGADQLSQSILEVIDQFNCKEKLVGQSYDGAAVMSGAQGGVQTKLNYNVQWLSLFLAMLTYLT
ncbi:hypothetical protein EVAR_34483_1 [Eumeta japonica]|uniref:DUF4371 domain-containing protein n=1 Tax=Eumeta variegata TaxID=151549 RepID=A0A4C1WUA8_EUMVA|nr:hypothetical protein EVAR_34483_1 [Eumeta japonica]